MMNIIIFLSPHKIRINFKFVKDISLQLFFKKYLSYQLNSSSHLICQCLL